MLKDAKFPKKIAIVLFLLGCLLFFLGFPYGMGFVFGCGLSMGLFLENISYCDSLLTLGNVSNKSMVGHTFLHAGLMFVGMALCVKFSHLSNLFTFTLGLFFVKLSYIAQDVSSKKKGGTNR